MNKHIRIAIFFTVLSAGFLSCKKDFLDNVPLGEAIATTTDDYEQLMNGKNFYSYLPTAGWDLPFVMEDDAALEGPYAAYLGPSLTNAFQWQAVIYQQTDQPEDLAIGLQNLYTLNKVINEVLGSTSGSDSAKKELQAEAMATRAWQYLQFVNFYAKPYLASTASTDPGFPVITVANATLTNYTRGAVQDVYDQMVKDLTTAIASLPVKISIPTRMSRQAAEGLLGKVYLFMGRYSDAATEFKAAFNDIATAGFPVLYNYNVTLGPGGSFLPINPNSGPSGPGNNPSDYTESVLFKVCYNLYANEGIVLAPQAASLFDPSDLRLQLYSANNVDGSSNVGGRLRKYGISYSRFGLELPDLYLMSAECKARTNDLSGAVTDIETLRRSRMPPADAIVPVDTSANQTALIKFIIDERIREYALEGYRWFDMRRLSVDPLFSGQAFIHTQYNDDATNSTTVYALDQPDRLTLQLPPYIMAANPGMTNNP